MADSLRGTPEMVRETGAKEHSFIDADRPRLLVRGFLGRGHCLPGPRCRKYHVAVRLPGSRPIWLFRVLHDLDLLQDGSGQGGQGGHAGVSGDWQPTQRAMVREVRLRQGLHGESWLRRSHCILHEKVPYNAIHCVLAFFCLEALRSVLP